MDKILYIRSKPKGKSLLSKFYFRKDINVSVIQNEYLNLLAFFKKNKHLFFKENKYIFIDLDYFKDKTEGRPYFQTSYWNNLLTEAERDKIVILNYNNELSIGASSLVKMKSFYKEEDLKEFLQNEKMLDEERYNNLEVFADYKELEEYPDFSTPYQDENEDTNIEDKENQEDVIENEAKEEEDSFQIFLDEEKDKDDLAIKDNSPLVVEEALKFNTEKSYDIDPFNDNMPLIPKSNIEKEASKQNIEIEENKQKEETEKKQDNNENREKELKGKAPQEDVEDFLNKFSSEDSSAAIENDYTEEMTLPNEKELERDKKTNANAKIKSIIKNPIRLKRIPKNKVVSTKEVKEQNKIFPENLVMPYIVNVVGAKAKIGTTYTSVYLAAQAEQEGYRACVVVSEEDYKILTHKDNAIKFKNIFSVTEKSKTREYDLIIYDLDSYDVNDNELMDKMFHANMKVLVIALSYPNYTSQYTIERYKEIENQYPVLALNFADEEDIRAFEKEYKKLTQVIPVPVRALG